MLDRDTHRNITPLGRRTLLTLGRWLYWNVSAVRGAVNEMCDLAVPSYIAQFEGEDQVWGTRVEDWLREHDKICDVRGWPFSMCSYRKNLIRGIINEGDIGTLLTQTATGYPMIQVIPAHRIGSNRWWTIDIVQGGPYDGARIIDGVILDDIGRPIAYRILGEDPNNSEVFQDVPAKDMFLSFLIETPDQIRGISALGASVFDWKDVKEARDFELLVQKLGASIGLIETNETGEADRAKGLMQRSSANFNDDQTLATTATETIDGVTIRYHRAGSNAKLEAYKNDRPTSNQHEFRADVVREALNGLGWSVDYSLNPTKIGGAPLRVVVDRLNRKLECIRSEIVQPAQARIDGYRVAKVMDNPARTDKQTILFPFNQDWWRWSYQGPAKLTADAKYESDVNLQERRSGNKSLSKSAAESGEYWRDLRGQREIEARDLLTRAMALSREFGIKIELALSILEKMDQNPVEAAKDPEPTQPQVA